MRHEVWIDRGGTFTDCVLFDRHTGSRTITKVLSSDDAPLVALRQLLHLAAADPIPPCDVYMGTTLATNALLERKGVPTALVITRGFADLLAIGDQTRPDLFSLTVPARPQLHAWTFEIDARLDAQGSVLAEPTDHELAALAQQLISVRAHSVALVCMHATAQPGFEQRLRTRLLSYFNGEPAPRVYCSSDSLAEQGLLARAGACVMDAYVSPALDVYMTHLQKELPGSRLHLMQSAGGLSTPLHFRGPQAILSGPAGGVVAAENVADALGLTQVVSLDMGGTSTDVSLISGRCELRRDTVIDGIAVRSPVLDIHTIAAGGGSICDFDGYRLTMGPESVGAAPGPLCYAQNSASPPHGHVAITDVNLVLGRLSADFFPFPLSLSASQQGLERVAQKIFEHTGQRPSVQTLARDFAALVSVQMAEAIRSLALSRGCDVRKLDLLLLGGAAGQHACDVARYLGTRRIFIHRLSGVLSAYGIGHADVLWQKEQDGRRLSLSAEHYPQLLAQFSELEMLGRQTQASPWDDAHLHAERWVELRYSGTESTIAIELLDCEQTLNHFNAQHSARFGYARPEQSVEVVLLRSQLRWKKPASRGAAQHLEASAAADSVRMQPVHLGDGTVRDVPVYYIGALKNGQRIPGPALLLDSTGTLLVDAGFTAQISGELLELHDETRHKQLTYDATARASILGHRFTAIATQMGEALRRSACSTNIRDRLDYSCALFDPDAHLIANAPHIPVHLGAMSATVRAMKRLHQHMQPGDSYISNDPALGGSHLPDITVVTPVFDARGQLLGFTASRGHHADVGGISPGSMPAHSTTLAEEGIVFSGQLLAAAGQFLDDSVLHVLGCGPYPARNPGENLADLKAQLAANLLGARLLHELSDELSREGLFSGMTELRALAQRWVEDSIAELPIGTHRLSDTMDDGTVISVSVHVEGRQLSIDFSGTSAERPSNVNAPYAVTLASILYVLRVLVGKPLPLNDGCLAPIHIHLPEHSVVNPSALAAVAAGNVETSQRIVDVLLGALGLSAAAQGTMNNLSFGNDRFGYYETIAGGVGATRLGHGASATHSHMTNTKITDPEIMEARFPVRVREFSVRRGSGGAGAFHGGDGIVRAIEALVPLHYTLLSDRRISMPFGLFGGMPGACGHNSLDGHMIEGRVTGTLGPGSVLRIETPGGGGYGVPDAVGVSALPAAAVSSLDLI